MKAAAKRSRVTEDELLAKDGEITPDDILALAAPTTKYLVKTTKNTFGIEFTAFKLRDLERDLTLLEVSKPPEMPYEPPTEDDDDSSRFVRYDFSPEFLELKTVGATVTFRIGDNPVANFRMIERHFVGDKIMKSFDFDFGFCIPQSSNTCEHIYEFPKLTEAEKKLMIANPYITKSDSFYFVDSVLVMHNKAEYSYNN